MSSAIENAQIVVLSSIDWDSAWQRHQIFAAQLAEAGHEVFFLENSGFRNPGPADLGRVWKKLKGLFAGAQKSPAAPKPSGLHVIAMPVLPPTWNLFRRLNVSRFIPKILKDLKGRGLGPYPVVICYFATPTTLEFIRRLAPSLLVYDCASNFRAHKHAPADFAIQEKKLLELSDLVVCDSDYLYQQKIKEHGSVVQIHQGVSETFFNAKPPAGKWNSFVYYGTWGMDLEPAFLNALAAQGFEVTLSGFIKGAPPALSPAVKQLAPTTLENLPRRLEQYEAYLMPYRITPFHLGVVPAKIYECLALGRPVLATPLPSLKPFKDLIYIAETPEEWVRIAKNLPNTETAALRQARIDLAKQHTHKQEFQRLSEEIKSAWREKTNA